MSTGFVVVTHADLGRSFVDQTECLLGPFPAPLRVVGVQPTDDPDGKLAEVGAAVAAVDAGDGVLILTDVFGATPSNIVHRLSSSPRRAIVHGLNLAMLMRAHNYADRPLDAVLAKVLEGGRAAIFAGRPA